MPTFSVWDLGGCNCITGCNAICFVGGCNNIAQAGVVVSAYTASGGTLLDSGTTDGSGFVTLNVGTAGAWWFEVTGMSARFAAFGATETVVCGSTVPLTLSPASGYYCMAGCGLPLKDTLNATWVSGGDSSFAGTTWTLVNTGTGWVQTQTLAGVNVTMIIGSSGIMGFASSSIFGPCNFNAIGPSPLVCPPSYAATYDANGLFSTPPSPNCTTAPPLGHDFTNGVVDVTE